MMDLYYKRSNYFNSKTISKGVYSLVVGLLAFMPSLASALERWDFNMPVGVTDISRNSYDLHMLVTYVCVAIGVVVFGIMGWSLVKHRKSVHPVPAKFSHSTKLEIVWTVIPIIILVALAFPAISTLANRYDTSKADLDIKVTGIQWKWHYDYIKKDISFYSSLSTSQDEIDNKKEKGANYLLEVDNEMVVPVNKKIRLLLTANDVIHAWWVPEFAIKMDTVPGYINDVWFKADTIGTYRGQCAELCGKNHGFMPIVVKVVSEADFDSWVSSKHAEKKQASAQAAQQSSKDWSKEELVSMGSSIYAKNCSACHQAKGQGMPPAFPALVSNDKVTNADAKTVINIVSNGVKGTSMQPYKTQLNTTELAAVISYIRNSWGNEATKVVPKDVSK